MKKTLATILMLALIASCVGMMFVSADELPEGAQVISISHVNHYSWGSYREMIVTGEGTNCRTIGYDCTWWIAIKVENQNGTYTVTQIEGNGDTKEMTAPADGYIVYCYSANNNYPASFEAAKNVEVGYVVYSNSVDLTANAASETEIGQVVFVPASALPGESSEATSSEETSNEETSSEATSSAETSVEATSSETSKPVQTGDSGILVFALLGAVAAAGVAVALKVRQ